MCENLVFGFVGRQRKVNEMEEVVVYIYREEKGR